MNNYYFSYLMQEYGKEQINQLIENVLQYGKIENPIHQFNMNDWSFIYFFSVYFATALRLCEVDYSRINLCLDMVVGPGWGLMFDTKKTLGLQKRSIPKIEQFIKDEYNKLYR